MDSVVDSEPPVVEQKINEEEEYDIYKGFESDEPLETSYEEPDEEWKILNLAVEDGDSKKEDEVKESNEDPDSKTVQSYATRPQASSPPSLMSLKVDNMPADEGEIQTEDSPSNNVSQIPSLMSIKTEPPDYYIKRRYEESGYGSRMRSSRYSGMDRKSSYRRKDPLDRSESSFKVYDRRNRYRSTDSRFK